MTIILATERGLLIARGNSRWSVEEHLKDKSPESLAVDPQNPDRILCGTSGYGLWRSDDAGGSWTTAGEGITHQEITAVAVSRAAGPRRYGPVYAGTEPSAVFRSDDRGETWEELSAFRALPSSSEWSFPPRPQTHHVRWIEADPVAPKRVYVAIEAGAMVRTLDGGRSWLDRVPEGPYDTHTAATHALAPGRVYSAAGDGYFESLDGGEHWSRQVNGLRHRYLVGVAVNPADPDDVIVSAAAGPWMAYTPRSAEAYVYRKSGKSSFARAMDGLPDAVGTIASRFATAPGERTIYAANNHGIFRTDDVGRTWNLLEIPWPKGAFTRGIDAVAFLPS